MQNPPSDPRFDEQPPALRAADSDRERVATALQRHFADGRLSYEELQERLQTTYSAKTYGELDLVLHDLPQGRRPAASASPVAGRPRHGGGGGGGGFGQHSRSAVQLIATYVVLSVFLIAIWVASGRHGSFWPIWPILVFGLITANRVIRGIGR